MIGLMEPYSRLIGPRRDVCGKLVCPRWGDINEPKIVQFYEVNPVHKQFHSTLITSSASECKARLFMFNVWPR